MILFFDGMLGTTFGGHNTNLVTTAKRNFKRIHNCLCILQEEYRGIKRWCEELQRQIYGGEVTDLIRQAATAPRAIESYTFARHVTIKGNLVVQATSQATKVNNVLYCRALSRILKSFGVI